MSDVETERAALTGVAYRMLGDLAEAEDAVQEAYLRWVRLGPDGRAEIERPGAWLTRVTARICLDMLGSARVRRERYVGPWLPEPLPVDAPPAERDPAEQVALDDSVSLALQIVLDAMTPPERVAFVLHDVFDVPFAEIAETMGRSVAATRQLASSARRRVRAHREARATRRQHDAVTLAFARAAAGGSLETLIALLDPAVVLTSDGGGRVSAARRPVHGAERVARFLLGTLRKNPDATLEPVATADGVGFLLRQRDAVAGIVVLGVSATGAVTDVWLMRNPAKLRSWS